MGPHKVFSGLGWGLRGSPGVLKGVRGSSGTPGPLELSALGLDGFANLTRPLLILQAARGGLLLRWSSLLLETRPAVEGCLPMDTVAYIAD